jgi:cysteinyl-tRNA synthetase
MPLTLYNTLTRRKEAFEPLDPSRVRLYVCGPTVYDRAHIGNGRAIVVFDVLYRLLREIYGREHVLYVRNITDIEDKINAAARKNGEPISALTARTTIAFHEDMDALGALRPKKEPRATEYIPQMIAMIGRLIAAGHAYEAEGHVLFAVASDPNYGQFSGRNRDEMIAGARVDVAPYKRDPADFVLWKPSDAETPGWDSPWGRGRPGWHIECSAMCEAHLGETFDIHGGGQDLIFPHHENEIAQSVCAHAGRPFARYWVHNGMLTDAGAKMSKSLGNIRTVRELLDEAPGEAIRLALLTTQYRDPLDWTSDRLRQARQTLDRFYRVLDSPETVGGRTYAPPRGTNDYIRSALEDDLNTPLAISQLHEIADEYNKTADGARRLKLQADLKSCGEVLGLLQGNPADWLRGEVLVTASTLARFGTDNPQDYLQQQIEAREQARRQRRFSDADRNRDELAAEGIILEDRPDGTTGWRRKD